MKVLVTGGSGFIGGHVVANLRERGIEVMVFDRCRHETGRHVVVPSQLQRSWSIRNTFLGDVRDEGAVNDAVSLCEGVIHLAGTLGTQETISTPKPVVETNIIGSLNVFHAVRLAKCRAVFITVGNHWMNNPYSITKTAAERFALMHNKEFGTRIAVVRGLNVYGPGQKERPVRKIMPNLVLPALRDEDIKVYGSGDQVMDMIHVRDMAELLVRALLNDHRVYNQVFQAGNGEDTTVNQLAQMVIKAAGSRSRVVHAPMRPGEIPDSVVKADRATWNLEKLDWTAEQFIPLEQGVYETVEWYRHW